MAMLINDKSSFTDWRRMAGYSVDDCVTVFGVTKRTIQNWELERQKPPAFQSARGFFGQGLDRV